MPLSGQQRMVSQRLMRFSRMVLLAYGLVIGLAGLSPWWHPPSLQIICLGNGGTKLIDLEETGDRAHDHLLACALCLPLQAPPTPAVHASALPPPPIQAPAAPERTAAVLAPRWRPPAQAPPLRS